MERTTHAGFVATSLGHPGRSVSHGTIDATTAQRHARAIRLIIKWLTVEYTLKRISRRSSVHEPKVLERPLRCLFAERGGQTYMAGTNITRTTCRMPAIANAA